MEFLGMLMAFISVFLIYKKPEKENLAFGLLVIAWIMGVLLYYGHISSLLPSTNL